MSSPRLNSISSSLMPGKRAGRPARTGSVVMRRCSAAALSFSSGVAAARRLAWMLRLATLASCLGLALVYLARKRTSNEVQHSPRGARGEPLPFARCSLLSAVQGIELNPSKR